MIKNEDDILEYITSNIKTKSKNVLKSISSCYCGVDIF